ncbi:acyl-CoA dehydrogenase [Klebsiella grimontii]|uniref:Acyl-CoA dehydrogenase n=1 Tax=Klebsiella grimontii TaxID=2058152 RepID=A0A7H4P2I1_9ENTR|nr:acyl-CoA dehydrogenase [Klebsiella grimontii]
MMLANIASIEIPPLQSTYLDWLKAQSRTHLARYGVDYEALHDRQFLPRILLGEYFRDQFLGLVAEAREQGFHIRVNESCRVSDLQATTERGQTVGRGWAGRRSLRPRGDCHRPRLAR